MFRLLNRRALIDLQDESGFTPLHVAAESGNVPACLALLDGGAQKEMTDDLGWTPLHVAAYTGHSQVASILLRQGASVNALTMKMV